jgi:transglutaminase-like putative cysteine protease
MKKILLILLFYTPFFYSQENFIAIFSDSIKANANAVIKQQNIDIEFNNYNSMNIKKYRVVTILNELGNNSIDALEYLDNSTSIKKIEAIIYDAFGREIKKIKRKDFKENSVSEGSIITDNRVIYLDYTPVQYPFTVVYESELSTSNTAFIPSWAPIEDYYVSVINSAIQIKYSPEVKFKYKEINCKDNLKKIDQPGILKYTINNSKALRKEDLAPSLKKYVPFVLFGLDKFQLEGVSGNAENWESFGKWMYTELLKDTEEISEETLSIVSKIIENETDNYAKAKRIYEYIQSKTRYVSVQLGIGGWKPMLAKNVDRLGYGDCKALTNYTRSLLKAFNIPSYYTIVYGDDNKRDIEDFVTMQGNHVILGIPNLKQEITWLECTSQSLPFGFNGDFTDDRKVLIVSENESRIVKTSPLVNEQNSQISKYDIQIQQNNSIKGNAKIVSKGVYYNNKLSLKTLNHEKIKNYYNEFFNTVSNIKITKNELKDEKLIPEFIENLDFEATEFIKVTQGQALLTLNCINQISFVPKKVKDRKMPFEIERGYNYEDEIVFELSAAYKFDTLPVDQNISNEFGEYIYSLKKEGQKLIYYRKILLKKGFYNPEKYENYRKFREQIARLENTKIILIPN